MPKEREISQPDEYRQEPAIPLSYDDSLRLELVINRKFDGMKQGAGAFPPQRNVGGKIPKRRPFGAPTEGEEDYHTRILDADSE